MINKAKPPIKMAKRRQTWEAFDALPREVRDALNYSAFKYAVAQCPAHKAKWLAAEIRAMDAKQVAAAYNQREAIDDLKELGL